MTAQLDAPAHLADPPSGRRGADLAAVGVWVASRIAVAVLSIGGAWTLSGAQAGQVEGFLQRWDRWDVGLFRKVAEFGYQGYPDLYPDRGIEAFFPGAPLVLRVLHLVVPNWTAAGLLMSLIAGAFASVALSRLAALEGVSGSRAVLYLVLSPYAVFLFAGYSEALFLAFALWGWLLARQDRWVAASLLVAAASTVRVSGLFLACGLVVQYAVAHRFRPRWDAAALAAPFLAIGAYFAYLHAITGDWLRWSHAQEEGWGRRFTHPVESFRTTFNAARDPGGAADFVWSFRAEIGAVVIGVALVVVLLVLRRFGEATYIALSVTALATSTYYLSVARATLLWFPLFLLIAAAAKRWGWVHTAYVAVCAPVMALLVITFSSGRWVG
ncbi:MAG: hypothetical protein JWM62_3308 [Frankiales bacterium]|jgi:hypothetical protein|nr:hypothetical protein [Frankiales bacterium]